jgi:hypothetical protein
MVVSSGMVADDGSAAGKSKSPIDTPAKSANFYA